VDIRIIAIGKVRDRAITALCEDMTGRIRHDARLEIVELKDSDSTQEGKRILETAAKRKAFRIVLSEEGRECTSREFATLLSRQTTGIDFIIGGPFGLSTDVKKQAGMLLSLSRMTFTHEMARLFLLEQVYRALSICNNRKYHK
jgi:23S rRNA (pseudouridine1915-N3)-methyltransferase